MSQLTSNLSTIYSIKQDIKSAIEAKGVDMTGMSFQDYPGAIGSISTAFVTETLSVSVNGTYTPSAGVDGYSQVVVDVPQSATGYSVKDIAERNYNIENLNDNSISYVAAGAFNHYTKLETVSLQNCTLLRTDAFSDCTSLTQVNLPICGFVSSGAFYGCTSLSQISLPECSTIGSYAFYNCKSLTQIYLPSCFSISTNAFQNCASISEIILPMCLNVSNSVFYNCTLLNSLTLCTDVYWTIPYVNRMLTGTAIINGTGSIYVRADTYNSWVTSTGWSSIAGRFVSVDYSFPAISFSNGLVSGTTILVSGNYRTYLGISSGDVTKISLTSCLSVMGFAFSGCYNLSQVTLPNCSFLDTDAFRNCSSLSELTLGYSSVCGYGNTYILHGTQLNTGSIYVPSSLVDEYKSANYWSNFSSRIFPISE